MNVDQRIASLAARQWGAFTREQASAAGATPAVIRHRLAVGRWDRAHAHVFRLAGTQGSWMQHLWAGWLGCGAGAVVSHGSAARLWAMPGASETPEITVAPGRRPAPSGVLVHRRAIAAGDSVAQSGLSVTTATRTLIDLGSSLDRHTLALSLDHCLSHRMTTSDHVERRLRVLGRSGRKGAGLLMELLAERSGLARPCESELERALFELLLELAGPPPVRQYEIRLPDGRVVRLDFAYPPIRLGIEADSYRHHSSRTDWSADHTRRNAVAALGWRILPVTWEDVMQRPDWVLALVAQARRAAV